MGVKDEGVNDRTDKPENTHEHQGWDHNFQNFCVFENTETER